MNLNVLEDWIYLYYLNLRAGHKYVELFLRTEFICIIWTGRQIRLLVFCSWGLNLFVLFERIGGIVYSPKGSWGLNLFVLFELIRRDWIYPDVLEDWIYLYYLNNSFFSTDGFNVLEDWIYLYYLNQVSGVIKQFRFLRTEFICIIWTQKGSWWHRERFLRTEFICIIWTVKCLKN